MNKFSMWSIFAIMLIYLNPSTFVEGECAPGPDDDCADGKVGDCCYDCESQVDCDAEDWSSGVGKCKWDNVLTCVYYDESTTVVPTTTDLTTTDLTTTDLTTTDLTTTDLTTTDLTTTDLTTTDLTTTDLTTTDEPTSTENGTVCVACDTYATELLQISHNVTISECPDEDADYTRPHDGGRHRARRMSTRRRTLGSSSDGDSKTKCICKSKPTNNGGWNNRRRRLRGGGGGGSGMQGGTGSDGSNPCNDDDGDDDDDEEVECTVITEVCLKYSLEIDGDCPLESIFFPLCNSSNIYDTNKINKLITSVKPSGYLYAEGYNNSDEFGIKVSFFNSSDSEHISQFQICLQNVIIANLSSNITQVFNSVDVADNAVFEDTDGVVTECDEDNDGLPCLDFYFARSGHDGLSDGSGHDAMISDNGNDGLSKNHELGMIQDMSALTWVIAFGIVVMICCLCIFCGFVYVRVCKKSTETDSNDAHGKTRNSIELGEKNDDGDFEIYGGGGYDDDDDVRRNLSDHEIVIEHQIMVDPEQYD